jgi:hypothetical protein
VADRAHVLGLLQRELAAAENAREVVYAARLRARIALLSAGTPDNPAAEKTAARRPARRRT